MSRYDVYTPWSFFWPVTLAVAAGSLLANLISLAFGALLAAGLMVGFQDAVKEQAITPGHLPARPNVIVGRPENLGPMQLLGPQGARDRGVSKACINGRVAHRLNNGWDQGNERCTAVTP